MNQSVVFSAFEIVLTFGERIVKRITTRAVLICLWVNLDWIALKEYFTLKRPISSFDSSLIALLVFVSACGYYLEWPKGATETTNQIVLGVVITLVNGVKCVSHLNSRLVWSR